MTSGVFSALALFWTYECIRLLDPYIFQEFTSWSDRKKLCFFFFSFVCVKTLMIQMSN